ncbi:MAG: toll/interleukin-1 receptor domain-containing protein [Candidatus Electrothrix scaldis]|nr:MAG: toll/interleukin-1 receptor domain-containing protein [Candidatus Electrothrix sp. GW3-3]
MSKIEIFISHRTEEEAIAKSLKKALTIGFLDMVEVFIASDPDSIQSGSKWVDKITRSLKKCHVEIILCSLYSITRPWIGFESGAGWIRDIPVIPICHSGLDKDNLNLPLSLLQSANATDIDDLNEVVLTIAGVLGSAPPNVDFLEFIDCVRKFSENSTKGDNSVNSLDDKTLELERPNNVTQGAVQYLKKTIHYCEDNIDLHLNILRLIDEAASSSTYENIEYDLFIREVSTFTKEETIESLRQLIKKGCLIVLPQRTLEGKKPFISITYYGKDILNRNPI